MLYDKDIREPLFEFLEETYGKNRIIEEKTLGKARADVMMVLEHGIVGIEIKSDADTYTRLDGQVKDYDKYFNYNMIVVGSSHAKFVADHVPEHWGIISVEEVDAKADFYIIREMQLNKKAKIKNQIKILWREELAHIQEINGMYKYARESKKFVQDKILEKVPEDLLLDQLCYELFERDYNGIADRINAYRGKARKKVKYKRLK